ncbi:DUF5682 family protein [Kitasatospora sp. P5_F3]
MTAVFLGVRHHSPACARLVAHAIETLRPAYVLVEGPADMNDRLDELLLGHRLPIAVFSHHRDDRRAATSWTPLCEYSPEWVALTAGRAAGAELRFIDLPAWHPAFEERTNRYADAEARYTEATGRLCERFAVDSVDALWDELFEVPTPDLAGLAERLDTYFDVVRGDTEAAPGDRAREEYMASWVRAALAEAGGRPVLVVTGGFHRPALRTLAASVGPAEGWPAVPVPPEGAVGGSFLVPYSFRQLDAFAGYQSGMPSPGYYQRVWEHGQQAAADGLFRSVAERLRARRHPVSTADLIAARGLTAGLATLRGHTAPSRLDVLDGLAGTLVNDDLDQPLPWARRGPLTPGTHPVVVELVRACGGDRVGALHPDTPLPPLVHDVAARLAEFGLTDGRPLTLRLTDPADLERSRVLHRLRVLGVPGLVRTEGPTHGADPVLTERWEPGPTAGREAALIEAGGYGASLAEAATAALGLRLGADGPGPAALLFDAVLCGATGLAEQVVAALAVGVRSERELGPLGEALGAALGLWRHDRVYGVARSPLLAEVIDGAVGRVLWLAEGLHGPAGPQLDRLRALVGVRDALLHAEELLTVTRETAGLVCRRISEDGRAPDDLRGAAFGLRCALGEAADRAAAVRAAGAPERLGDWLGGLFVLARGELTAPGADAEALLPVLDGLVTAMTDREFLVALPSLRQAFAWFPPREREQVARSLIERRGLRGSARALLRTTADPLLIARARHLEDAVRHRIDRHGLQAAR